MEKIGSAKNIVIIGLSGTGKTSVAESISATTARTLLDTDKIIEESIKMSIPDIFKSKGEAYFRKLEYEVIQEVSDETGSVIACGGGSVLDPRNFAALRRHGVIFCLWAEIDELCRRIGDDHERPLLTGNLYDNLCRQLAERETILRSADIHINTLGKTVQEIAKQIVLIFDRLAQSS
jgi:shikimate kinase